MGYTRKKICSSPGCKNFALSNSAYCEIHQKEVNRGTTSKFDNFYHKTWWKQARKTFLIKHFWCAECLAKGKHELADTVHHKYGFCDWKTFSDQRHWVALCHSCHSTIHSKVTNEELYQQNREKF